MTDYTVLLEYISIHALREEGDIIEGSARQVNNISIHALREEGDPWQSGRTAGGREISIHALREEGDEWVFPLETNDNEFLSTPSARRATLRFTTRPFSYLYFYPRPPRGGRQF